MNDYEFWNEYLKKIRKEILKLCEKKEEIFIDLHIHSNYSSDGNQNLNQILENTKNQGFDVIAITDHDTLNAYDELFNYVKVGITTPIVIPGIEFTIDSREYGGQCHLLQLFINPKDKIIQKNVEVNYEAVFNRSKKQFVRLNENLAIKEILKNKKISISYNAYKKYLLANEMTPEYSTLCFYLIDSLRKKNVTTFDVLDLLEKYNILDSFNDRKILKEKRYKELRDKYNYIESNFYNPRFLLSMLAVKDVDDDWWDKPSSGSLSVNSYGQLKVEDLNEKYNIFFAHPEEKKLNAVDKIVKNKKNIIGFELNKKSKYEDITNFYNILNNNKLLKITGSDNHDNTLELYNDMNFYMIESDKLKSIINLN